MTREQKLKLIYRHTHRDFRGTVEGVKSILVLREGGTCLVPLTALSEDEINMKMLHVIRAEARRVQKRSGYSLGACVNIAEANLGRK